MSTTESVHFWGNATQCWGNLAVDESLMGDTLEQTIILSRRSSSASGGFMLVACPFL